MVVSLRIVDSSRIQERCSSGVSHAGDRLSVAEIRGFNGSDKLGLVTGHDFSRAANAAK